MNLSEWIGRVWGLKGDVRFPGPQPISIERKHFPILKRNRYVVCEKTDGVRYLLVSDPDRHVALVNRSFEQTIVYMNIPKNTILDGELVECRDGRKLFVVHDAVLIKDENISERPLTERLDRAKSIVRQVISTPKSPFRIVVKTMVPFEEFDTLKKEYPYETDGLVFTPIDEPIRTGTHETMFKWKPRSNITIDFLIRGRELYIQERGNLIKKCELYGPCDCPDESIIECEYGEVGWQFLKRRTDKSYPNNHRTYLRTIVNIREDIQYHEFSRNGNGQKNN